MALARARLSPASRRSASSAAVLPGADMRRAMLRGGSVLHREHPYGAGHVPGLCRRVAPRQVQVRRAAAADAAVLRVAVVGVAVPADPAERWPRVVLARLGPLRQPGDRAPAAAGTGIEVCGQPERVLAVQLVPVYLVAGADLHVVAPDQVEHVGEDAAVHAG